MSGFSNPLVGGGGSLVYPSIHSPNFNEATQTGWSIDKNGNAFFYGIVTSGEFTGTNFIINSAGAFLYGGPPALGNLILSVSQNGGTDSFGNVVKPGFASYEGNPIIVAQLFGGQVSFLQEGTTNTPASIGLGGVSPTSQGLHLSSGNVIPGVTPGTLSILDGNSGVAAGVPAVEVNGTFEASAGSSAGQVVLVVNTTAGPSEPALQIVVAQAADNSFGIMVNGDGFNRVKLTTRELSMGTGTGGQDTRLYRSQAGVWGTDTLEQNVGGNAESWHAAAYANSWGDGAGRTPSQYRLIPSPANSVELEGSLTIPSGFAGGQTIFTLPAAYRPVTTKSMIGREVTRNSVALFSISTTGLVAWQGASGAVAGDTVDFHHIFQLDI